MYIEKIDLGSLTGHCGDIKKFELDAELHEGDFVETLNVRDKGGVFSITLFIRRANKNTNKGEGSQLQVWIVCCDVTIRLPKYMRCIGSIDDSYVLYAG